MSGMLCVACCSVQQPYPNLLEAVAAIRLVCSLPSSRTAQFYMSSGNIMGKLTLGWECNAHCEVYGVRSISALP